MTKHQSAQNSIHLFMTLFFLFRSELICLSEFFIDLFFPLLLGAIVWNHILMHFMFLD